MKYVKYLWPIALYFAAILVCVNEWNKNASTDTGGIIIFAMVAFFLILPVCTFIAGMWYGFVLRGEFKWMIFPIALIPGVVILGFCADTFSLGSIMFVVPSVISALIGSLIGSVIWKVKQGRAQKDE